MRYTTIVGIFTVMLMLVSGLVFAENECPPGTVAVEDEAGVVIGCGPSEEHTTKSEETEATVVTDPAEPKPEQDE